MPPIAASLEELLRPLKEDPANAAVLLDVDGVLAPIVQHADDAHMPETTRRPLIEVAKLYRVVACTRRDQACSSRSSSGAVDPGRRTSDPCDPR